MPCDEDRVHVDDVAMCFTNIAHIFDRLLPVDAFATCRLDFRKLAISSTVVSRAAGEASYSPDIQDVFRAHGRRHVVQDVFHAHGRRHVAVQIRRLLAVDLSPKLELGYPPGILDTNAYNLRVPFRR